MWALEWLVLLSFVGVRVGVTPCRNPLRKNPKNLHAKSLPFSSYSFRDISDHTDMARSTLLVVVNASFYLLHTFRRI